MLFYYSSMHLEMRLIDPLIDPFVHPMAGLSIGRFKCVNFGHALMCVCVCACVFRCPSSLRLGNSLISAACLCVCVYVCVCVRACVSAPLCIHLSASDRKYAISQIRKKGLWMADGRTDQRMDERINRPTDGQTLS